MLKKIIFLASTIILLKIFFLYNNSYINEKNNNQINIINHIQFSDQSKQNIFPKRVLEFNTKNIKQKI
jgi:hypothetical protein